MTNTPASWTTETPTQPGWYFAYGTYSPVHEDSYYVDGGGCTQRTPPELICVELTMEGDQLFMYPGENGAQGPESSGYTHWAKIEMPAAPTKDKP